MKAIPGRAVVNTYALRPAEQSVEKMSTAIFVRKSDDQ